MAQIDASIPLGVRPAQFEDPMNRLVKLMQVKAAQNQNELAQYTIGKARREDDETNALSSLYQSALKPDGTIDRNALTSGMATRGLGSKIPALLKTFQEQDTATVTADSAKFKLAKERHDLFKSTLGALAQEPNLSKDLVIQAGQSMVDQGILPAAMFQQSLANMPDDPMQLRARLTQGLKSQMTPEQIFTVFSPKPTQVDNGQQIGFRDTNPNSPTYGQATGGAPVQKMADPGAVLTDQRTRSEGALNRGVTIRGQDKADARAREANAQGKVPAGYRQKADGSLEFIPGGPADPSTVKDKALTEGQAKANLFGTRMQESNKVLAEMEKSGVKRPGVIKSVAESVGNIAGLGTESMGGALSDAAGTMTNWTQSAEQQQVEQAQRDFLNAVLRRESGASIAPHEFRNANKQYFPQPNDDDATLAQKARNRQIAIDGMLAEVPEGKRTKVAAPAAPTKITNDAEFNALPKGAEFIGPDGKHRRKP